MKWTQSNVKFKILVAFDFAYISCSLEELLNMKEVLGICGVDLSLIQTVVDMA